MRGRPAQPEIRQLGIIGDRRTAAIIDSTGAIVWYCPGRFDQPSLFAALLDAEKGGAWSLELPASVACGRAYLEEGAILETRFKLGSGDFSVKDWMPIGADTPRSICRLFSVAPEPIRVWLSPAPGYAMVTAELRQADGGVRINGSQWLYASHPLTIDGDDIRLDLPAGEQGFAVLADAARAVPSRDDLQSWLEHTLVQWREIAAHVTYHGPFELQVAQSLRALRLLTHAETGGIIAAATTSLPEVPGGQRNYDYRYVWMRDAAMIVSALVRAGSSGPDERAFLGFICGSRQNESGKPPLPPFLSLDLGPAPDESHLDLAGFANSRPVRIGNDAVSQLQLDAFGNVLLAAKLIYGRHRTREHWETVSQIAEFVAGHWGEPDHGIWEEHQLRQFTSSKVIVACGLRYIADFSSDDPQARRWRAAASRLDAFVAERCMTDDGAYAAFAGSQSVDVSAVLFPVWGYVAADSPAMLATIRALDRDYCRNDLYWRHLEELDRFREGAFLAGTLWVAQYWLARNDLARARRILDAALACANDLGLFAEEADPATGKMLGNFPQTFVHASLVGAVLDYRDAVAAGRNPAE